MTCDYWGIMLANHWQEPLPGEFFFTCHREEGRGWNKPGSSLNPVPGACELAVTDGRARGVIWQSQGSKPIYK